MLKKRGRRRLWAVLGTMLLAAALGVCALAASDVPKAVLNARESVVRIMTEGAMGSGFALSENSVYVVTNHHVIEGAETIEVIVDDTRWTTARVYVDLPGKDICILKTDKPLRGMPGLPLRSDAVETGLAVYALGYPGAADDFSREFATGVDSITVTDGIVSAVRQSRAEGLQTTWAIQTNTPISPGNSGGPLVDAGGRLVGINTFIMLKGQNVNGSIHVRELLTVLQQNDIPYRKAAPGFAGVLLVVLAVAAALGVCAALLLRLRRRGAASGKPMREKAVPLPVFLAGGGRMDRLRATRAVRELAQRLASMPEVSRALHPENILVRSGTLELKRAHGAGKRPGASVCAGYSAPECYNGSAGMAAAVYFLGAVLYALTEGRAPQDVIARAGGAELVVQKFLGAGQDGVLVLPAGAGQGQTHDAEHVLQGIYHLVKIIGFTGLGVNTPGLLCYCKAALQPLQPVVDLLYQGVLKKIAVLSLDADLCIFNKKGSVIHISPSVL